MPLPLNSSKFSLFTFYNIFLGVEGSKTMKNDRVGKLDFKNFNIFKKHPKPYKL